MGQLETAVEYGGMAEHHIFHAHLVVFGDVTCAGKPHQVHDSFAIGEVGYQALVAWSIVKRLKTEDFPFYLNERHTFHQLRYLVEMPPVDIFVGVILQHVTKRMDIQLFV